MSSPDEGSGRRRFLQFSMAALASASAPGGVWAFQKILAIDDPLKHYPYRSWEDLYRKEWTWDSVGFTTHSNGCVGGCAWKVYVKNGVPMREEQVSEYPQLPGIPDMNPRGCQKGAVYCSWVKQPDFLKYPLKRVGERGERKWKRISWDEALTEIADKMIDTTLQRGPGNICIPKRPFAVISNTGYTRLANLLGGIKPDVSSMTGDLYPGIQTGAHRLHFRRLVYVGPDPDVAQEPHRHAHPGRPLPDGGTLQRRATGEHLGGLQPLVGACRSVRAGEDGD